MFATAQDAVLHWIQHVITSPPNSLSGYHAHPPQKLLDAYINRAGTAPQIYNGSLVVVLSNRVHPLADRTAVLLLILETWELKTLPSAATMMLLNVIAALALNSVICFASPLPVTAPEACAPIHIMSARGSNQPQGEGPTLTPLADAIAAAHPGSSREPIVWPANIIPYDINSHNGTLAVTAQLTAYVKKCPTSKIVMLGYSQGAHVIMDSLCGGGGVVGIGPITPPISKDIGSHGMSGLFFFNLVRMF
ncbi:hypothetical protein PRK78_003068 [Emydomyces testavorans]|uniref:Cutinase n=1 Tax=Emydomyces testavorans TaxID=2070801 RepID=A0AAF0DFD7_9EURO|nr:hypothetical protein PRK78_003068 [Emydomyces testavorans]